jgi:hypothetical protein
LQERLQVIRDGLDAPCACHAIVEGTVA